MFRLAPYRPSPVASGDASTTKRLSKEEILSVVDLSTQEAQQSSRAGSSKDRDKALERTDPIVKELTVALDELFCHKLLIPNKRYWPAVKEFLSKSQIEELIIRWGPKSERGYSLAWLFHSLNEATLEYQLLSFRQGRHVLLRFYNKNAYVLDPGLLETVARFVARLNNAHFDLRPPDQGVPLPSLSASVASIPVAYAVVADERVPIARPAPDINGPRSAKGKRPPRSPNAAVAVAENGHVQTGEQRRLKKTTNAISRRRTASSSQTATPLSSTPVCRPDLEDSLLSSGRDQDFLFREVLHYNRRTSPDGMEVAANGGVSERHAPNSSNALNARRPSTGSAGQPELTTDQSAAAAPFQRWFQDPIIPPPAPPSKHPVLKPSPAEDFDETLRKRLTAVKIDQAANFTDSWDMERAEKKADGDKDEPKENGVIDDSASDWKVPDCPEGEIMLESGEIVRLAVQVFVQEGERFYKLFRVYLNHNTGAPLMRWLLLTNYAMYLLTRTAGDTFASAAANRPDEQAEHADLERTNSGELNYEIDKMTPLEQIDYISVGLFAQLFTVVVRDKAKSLSVCTATEMQTRSILSSLELAVRRCSTGRLDPPSVLVDATPQRLMLAKWAKSELDTPTLDIVAYVLVYWRTTPTGESDSSGALLPSRAGYLYHRRHFPKAWLQTNTEWQQSYFMLRGQKLYQFSDSSCKFGEKVFDLRHDVAGCRETQLKDHQNAFEFVLPDEEETIHFSCQTKHEAQQWTQAVLLALSTAGGTEEDDVFVACFMLLTTTHLLLGQESTSYGFVRTLATVALDQLDRVFIVRTDEQNALAVTPTGSKQRYWLLFRTGVELDRVIHLLHEKAGICAVETAQDSHDESLINSTESSGVVEQCMEMADVWRTCTQF